MHSTTLSTIHLFLMPKSPLNLLTDFVQLLLAVLRCSYV
jgi:hypothetical protein